MNGNIYIYTPLNSDIYFFFFGKKHFVVRKFKRLLKSERVSENSHKTKSIKNNKKTICYFNISLNTWKYVSCKELISLI